MKIPSKSNPKWQELILNNESIQFKNLAFQMLITRTKERFNNNEIDEISAISLLYDFCVNNISGSKLQDDLKPIFNISESNTFETNTNTQTKKITEDLNITKNQIVTKFEKTKKLAEKNSNNDQNEIKIDFNIETEREKLTKQLEALKIQFDETQKSNNQKKNEGFFKKLFK